MAEAEQAKLARLYRGLRQRELMRQDPVGLRVLEDRLRPTLEGVSSSLAPEDDRALAEAPPRRIAVAMAMALLSHPHLVQTFTSSPSRTLLVPTPQLQAALGLSSWELDDLREEVDRRAGLWLKQVTLVRWLESRFRGPELFGRLFTGAKVGQPDVQFHGSHLVCLADLPAMSGSALHLPWVGEAGRTPLTSFKGRYVDAGLRRDIARGVGFPVEEVDEILECTVALLPRIDLDQHLAREAWRHEGFAALTSLGQAYPRLGWLCEPADGRATRWRDWLQGSNNNLEVVEPDHTFDALLEPRVHGMMVGLYGDVLARRLAGGRQDDELDVFDLAPHVDAVTGPLLGWARSRSSAVEVAFALGTEQSEAEAQLATIHTAWKTRAASWSRPSNHDFLQTPHASWMTRLLRLDRALLDIAARPELEHPHRALLFLFAGHFLAESPMDRGLVSSSEDGGSVGLAVSRWFWPTWRRVLAEVDDEGNTTSPGFEVPEGLF